MGTKLPVGIENFEEFSTQDFCYIDNDVYIGTAAHLGKSEFVHTPSPFWQITHYEYVEGFFEIGSEKALFEELKIAQEKGLCG